MARTLDQIIAELNPAFTPQVESLQKQAQLIPGQIAEQEKGLIAQKDNAFNDILSGARQRGLGFSGIPLAEQAKFTATNFLPALAGLRSQGQQRAQSLQDAILGVQERKNTLAQSIYGGELDREAAQRAAASAARAAAIQPTFGDLFQQSQTQAQPTAQPSVVRNKQGDFSFFGADKKPITAGQFANATNQDIRDVLFEIAKDGNTKAARFYNILRPIKDPTLFNRMVQQLSIEAPYVFNGYVTSRPFAPINSKQVSQTAQTAQAPAQSNFRPSGFVLGQPVTQGFGVL